MNPFDWLRPRTIQGDVCFVRLTVHSRDGEPFEERPWRVLDNSNLRLREEIAAVVRENMGSAFEVRALTVGRGSIEIVVLIGTVYYAISRYKNFVESIELMLKQLKEVVKHFFERSAPMSVTVSASWTPAGGLIAAAPVASARSNPALWYLIVSHAAMLAVILWLLVLKLRT